jgi:ankyrin repeat protein
MCCKRPLSLAELAIAVSMDAEDEVVDEDKRLDDDETLLEICGSLIKINNDTNIVELGHFSVREFLSLRRFPDGKKNAHFLDTAESDAVLCKICFTYLSSPPFIDCRSIQDADQLEALFVENGFLLYAAFQWPRHAMGSDPENSHQDLVMKFLKINPNGAYRLWSQLWQLLLRHNVLDLPHEAVQRAFSLNSKLPKTFLQQANYDASTVVSANSVYYAVAFRFSRVLQCLLDQGADVNGGHLNQFIPLIAASSCGDLQMVMQLLKAGADVNAQEVMIEHGHLGVFDAKKEEAIRALSELFLDRNGAACGRTALTVAAKAGHKDIVKILLKHGANVDDTDNLGLTALLYAAERGHTEIVQELLALGAKVDRYYMMLRQTALSVAIENQHLEIVQLCLAAHAGLERNIDFEVLRTTSELKEGIHLHMDNLQRLVDEGVDRDTYDTREVAARETLLTLAAGLLENMLADMRHKDAVIAVRTAALSGSDVEDVLLGTIWGRYAFGPKYLYALGRKLSLLLKETDETVALSLVDFLLKETFSEL